MLLSIFEMKIVILSILQYHVYNLRMIADCMHAHSKKSWEYEWANSCLREGKGRQIKRFYPLNNAYGGYMQG